MTNMKNQSVYSLGITPSGGVLKLNRHMVGDGKNAI